MPLYTNIGGTRKELTSIYPNIGGARKSMAAMYANIDGAQKQIFTNRKTVQLSTLSAGDSFYLTDSEGFSEYKLIKKATDYTNGTSNPISVIMAMRVNALDVDILSAVKEIEAVNYGDVDVAQAVNSLSAVKTYKNSVGSYMYNMYIPTEGATVNNGTWILPSYNAVGVFLGLEYLANYNIYDSDATHYGLYFYTAAGNGTPSDIVNTKSKSDVYCYYNSNERSDNSGSSDLDYWYYKNFWHSGKFVSATRRKYSPTGDTSSYIIEYYSLPSALYFRPHVIFAANKEVTILIP